MICPLEPQLSRRHRVVFNTLCAVAFGAFVFIALAAVEHTWASL